MDSGVGTVGIHFYWLSRWETKSPSAQHREGLHVGSLLVIMLLRRLQQTGHRPIVLIGGGTTKVGDPSGKDAARQMLDEAAIARNKVGIKGVFSKFLDFGDGPTDAIMVDNDDWLDGIKYLEFLRD